jgi:hypothetical protein
VLLVSRASSLLSHKKKSDRLGFFDTEEEALAWLAVSRPQAPT